MGKEQKEELGSDEESVICTAETPLLRGLFQDFLSFQMTTPALHGQKWADPQGSGS